jgi:hypothetical protein
MAEEKPKKKKQTSEEDPPNFNPYPSAPSISLKLINQDSVIEDVSPSSPLKERVSSVNLDGKDPTVLEIGIPE